MILWLCTMLRGRPRRREPRELWLKARAGLRVYSGWARPPGLHRLQPSRELSGVCSGWACVVLRHKNSEYERRPAGHPSGRWIPFFPSLPSIGAWRGARRRGTRPEGLACGRRRRLEQCPASCSSEIRRPNPPRRETWRAQRTLETYKTTTPSYEATQRNRRQYESSTPIRRRRVYELRMSEL